MLGAIEELEKIKFNPVSILSCAALAGIPVLWDSVSACVNSSIYYAELQVCVMLVQSRNALKTAKWSAGVHFWKRKKKWEEGSIESS